MQARITNLERAFETDPGSFRTAYWIGEAYRTWSFEGEANYKELAEKAIEWLDRAASLNRFDPYPHMRKAMCLDWLKRHTEAEIEIHKALALDPKHYLVLAIAGWHYYQTEEILKALHYFTESHKHNSQNNPIVNPYFRLIGERLKTGQK